MMVKPQQVYRRNQFETATPAELTLKLYEGAVRFLMQAEEAITQKEYHVAGERLTRVQEIVRELMLTLDTTVEIGQQLEGLYDYMHHRLIEANVKKDKAIVEEVRTLLIELYDAWKEVVKFSRQARSPVGVGM